jgi:hydrogenase nickel incorporation protein HypB
VAHEHDHHHHDDHLGHSHSHEDATATVTRIAVEKALLAENDRFAAGNREAFDAAGARCLNLISGPGAGKTTLLEKTLAGLRGRSVACAVVEGDQTTDLDARRVALTGAPVVQIETGRSCHLDAHQVGHALERLEIPRDGFLFIENVGNLICPTEFQLGEHERVTIVSVAEGSDKPAKYPLAFRTATAVVISKIDLLEHVDFDVAEARRLIRGLNARAPIFELSARTGAGMDAWLSWLQSIR